MAQKIIGNISQEVIDTLKLNVEANVPIYIGDLNIKHIIKKHPNDYKKYGAYIKQIISTPDYIGLNPKDNSIEYVKEFKVDNEYIKVAVRISNNGVYFARSLYKLNNNRVANFIKNGSLHKT